MPRIETVLRDPVPPGALDARGNDIHGMPAFRERSSKAENEHLNSTHFDPGNDKCDLQNLLLNTSSRLALESLPK